MDSDIEVIDNSITSDTDHRTIFVAGSEDDSDDENYDSNNTTNCKSLRLSLSDAEDSTVRSDNDEDRSRMDSKSQLENSYNAADGSDSEEEAQEMSPELLPRRPPPKKDQEDTSFIGRKTKKRIMLIDSDTDNSIIIEHDKNKKMTCLKDTPVKLTTDKDLYQSTLKKVNITANMSRDDSEMCNSDIDDSGSEAEDESKTEEDNAEPVLPNRNLSDEEHSAAEHDDNHADSGTNCDNDDDEEEEAMIFSKATRMSIMGIVPKNDDESDDSDFIASDESNHKSVGSTNSLNDLPDVELSTTLPHTPLKATKPTNSNHKSVSSTNNLNDLPDVELSTTLPQTPLKAMIPTNSNPKSVGSNNSLYDLPDVELSMTLPQTPLKTTNPTNSNHKSVGSTNSLNDLPDVELSTTLSHTPLKATKPTNSNHKSVSSTNNLNDLPDVELSTTLPQTPLNTTKPTNSNHKSMGSTNSLNDLPDVELSTTLPQTPLKTTKPTNDSDSSRISCSPFSSPMADLTNHNILKTTGNVKENTKKSIVVDSEGDDLIIIEDNQNTSTFSRNSRITSSKRMRLSSKENEIVYDEDVTIIDSKPEVIALSSDDEDEEKKRSPGPKKVSQDSNEESKTKRSQDIKQYLLPESYPNQVVYVKKNVRENELRKLEGLKADLHGVKVLLEKMDPSYLPDTGMKLGERLASLEKQVRVQGTKVANMLVEPDSPSIEQMSNDGFGSQDKGLSWDDLQAGSNAVQPRWFGKQGMATHMAERNLILERLRLLHASLASRPAEDAHAPAPRALRATLLPHQAHALAWLQWRETQRPPAGILADDMGLGKTITMIALIASDKERASEGDSDDEDYAGQKLIKGGSLVVCPASLIQQWANEVTKHCKPHQLSVSLHHGANRAKQAGRLAHNDIVVTTYNILQRDGDASGVLGRILWRRIILDEAHVVRNHKSATSNAVCTLKGSRRWCLTGTPVQNKDLDLFALVKFMRCSPFDDLVMWKKWIDNKSHGGQERMSTLMRCILLRRSKAQLQARGQLSCLPARTAHLKEVTLSQQEMNVYQKVLVFSKTLFAQFLEQRAEKQAAGGFGGRGNAAYDNMHKKMIALQGAKPVKSHEILVLLLRLRQVCCHCGLIAAMLDAADADAGLDEDAGSKDLLAELNKLSLDDSTVKVSSNVEDETAAPDEGTSVTEAIRSVLSPNNPVFNLKQRSSKIEAVMDCLESNVFKNKGEKAIVVSQWTSVLRLVETELLSRKIKCVTLSGAVPVAQRHALVTKINDPNSDVTVMLLSLCAGGVGLNLCGANHLLLLDPHWNPQLEEQAQDRIYRVGQRRAVHVYRFMCVDTVEQSIRNLQQAKLKLAEAVLTGAKNSASKLTIEDLKLLFNMGPTSQDKPVK